MANTSPLAPVYNSPQVDGTLIHPSDLHIELKPMVDVDAGDTHVSSDFEIRRTDNDELVWYAYGVGGAIKVHAHFGDGKFIGSLAGKRALDFSTDYTIRVRYRDSSADVATQDSAWSNRLIHTRDYVAPTPGAAGWIARDGYKVVEVASGFTLPTQIVFTPTLTHVPTDPLYYVVELYGTIKYVQNDGTVGVFATDLLNYGPSGTFPGDGEQGLGGFCIDPADGSMYLGLIYNPTPGVQNTQGYPRILKIKPSADGKSVASTQVLLDMPTETVGASHFISNLSIGPDHKLYVHIGDGFVPETSLNLDSFRGKIIRMNLDGTAPTDNVMYNAADGINSRDYIYAYGVRNAFAGVWRPSDGKHYFAENGPNVDRFAVISYPGENYAFDGTNDSERVNALYNWDPAVAPVNLAVIDNAVFGRSTYPVSMNDTIYVTESGPTYAQGVSEFGKVIRQFRVSSGGSLISGPADFVRYNGTGFASVAALATGEDGLYFSDLYADQGTSPIDAGAKIYKVIYVGTAVPLDPSALTATVATAAGTPVTLNWIDNADNETGFVVERSIAASFRGATAFNVAANATSFIDTAVEPSTKYYYRVRAINTFGVSANSNFANASTPEQTNYVKVTGAVIGTAGSYENGGNTIAKAFDGDIDTFFDAPEITNGNDTWAGLDLGTSYAIDRVRVSPRFEWSDRMIGGLIQASNDSTFSEVVTLATITAKPTEGDWLTINVTGNARYRYVRYYSPDNGWGNVAEVEVYKNPVVLPPLTPTIVTATATAPASVTLTWGDESDDELGFTIERALTPTFRNAVATNVAANTSSYVDTTVEPGTKYCYRVTAFNSLVGTPSGYSQVKTADTTTRTTLTGTAIGTAGTYSNNNTIAKVFDDDADTYFDAPTTSNGNGTWAGLDLGSVQPIETIRFVPRFDWSSRMVGGKFQFATNATFTTGVTDMYTITAAPLEGNWTTITLAATVNARYVRYLSPNDGWGNVAEVRWQRGAETTPATPTNPVAAVSGAGIKLTWVDAANNETAYLIERAVSTSFRGITTITLAANTTTYTDLAVDPGTIYYYRVVAINTKRSDPSIVVSATTAAASGFIKRTGTVIGTLQSYGGSGMVKEKAMDGNADTFFDAPVATGAWVGQDLGSAIAVSRIRYVPRFDWSSRMVGGVFQASNSATFASGVVTLATITAQPTEGAWTTINLATPAAYRYIRYLSPTNGWGNVAEVQFYSGAAPVGVGSSTTKTTTTTVKTASVQSTLPAVQTTPTKKK